MQNQNIKRKSRDCLIRVTDKSFTSHNSVSTWGAVGEGVIKEKITFEETTQFSFYIYRKIMYISKKCVTINIGINIVKQDLKIPKQLTQRVSSADSRVIHIRRSQL